MQTFRVFSWIPNYINLPIKILYIFANLLENFPMILLDSLFFLRKCSRKCRKNAQLIKQHNLYFPYIFCSSTYLHIFAKKIFLLETLPGAPRNFLLLSRMSFPEKSFIPLFSRGISRMSTSGPILDRSRQRILRVLPASEALLGSMPGKESGFAC